MDYQQAQTDNVADSGAQQRSHSDTSRHSSTSNSTHHIAHDLNDPSRLRSKDVALNEDVSFTDLMLSDNTQLGLRRCGFERPSPVQLETIPLGRCGFDLVIQSKAGTGKTCIFTLVALEALASNSASNCTQTLIVAPTREIAIQIHEVITHIGNFYKNLRCVLCIGGVEVKQDRARLSGACQIVVGTPGRLKQLIELNLLKTRFIELFVLDEADKLMDEQFKGQVDEIFKRMPRDKQMIVTSATYPDELAQFLQRYMRAPKYVRVGKELSLEAIQEYYVECRAGHSGKKTLENKLDCLKRLLNQLKFEKCFIFTNYQSRAPQICDNLNLDSDFATSHGKSDYICAELSQEDRSKIFVKFKRHPEQKVLVSTDISARGIDIEGVELVINFDLPNDSTTYYHRIGRAGRFGQAGSAVSIVSSESLDRALFAKSVKSDKIIKLTLTD